MANWQRRYRKLFDLAALKEPDGSFKRCHPHMFRDTFAVASLLSGMRLEDVSTILGHSSVKVTEKHYMPWVRARQTSLNQSVIDSWVKQGKTNPGKPRRAPVVTLPVASREQKSYAVGFAHRRRMRCTTDSGILYMVRWRRAPFLGA